MNLARVFKKYEQSYTITRYTITRTAAGESKVSATHDVKAYIHPADGEDLKYIGQGSHIEDIIKIFCVNGVDIIVNDEVTYLGKKYRVMKDSARKVGNYKKLFAELVK